MKKITFKTRRGVPMVRMGNNTFIFDAVGDALEFIFKERGLLK